MTAEGRGARRSVDPCPGVRYQGGMQPTSAPLVVLAGVILAASACTAIDGRPADHPCAGPPNIVIVLTDDQRADALGCAGNPILQTPRMDALAESGVRFTRAFVTTPICAASRASILTGLYERAHGYTFQRPPLAPEHVHLSYPALLRSAGYRTGFVGKLGVRLPDGAAAEMFDAFHPRVYPYFADDLGGRHLTDANTDRAIEFLRESDRGRPFCLSISYNAPHAEDANPEQYVWPEACDSLYADIEIPPPATSDAALFATLPAFLRDSLNRERWRWRPKRPYKRWKTPAGSVQTR